MTRGEGQGFFEGMPRICVARLYDGINDNSNAESFLRVAYSEHIYIYGPDRLDP